jgi:hypothetical protein
MRGPLSAHPNLTGKERRNQTSPSQALHNQKLSGQISGTTVPFDRAGINADYFAGRAVVSFWYSPTHLFSAGGDLGRSPC